MVKHPEYIVEESANPKETPRRLAYFPRNQVVRFESENDPEKLVMTFPHLIIREAICFLIVIIVLALLALLFDAPLEEIANPHHTPNPAKAPWYFLGLQELLHNFPPVVAGVLIPFMVVVALVVIPYFEINIKREGLWSNNPRRTFQVFSSVIVVLTVVCAFFHAFSIIIPTLLLYGIALLPYFIKHDKGWIKWLSRRSLTEWIMTWFILLTTVLTLIGTFFRGPGWAWIWPWQ